MTTMQLHNNRSNFALGQLLRYGTVPNEQKLTMLRSIS